MPRVQGNGVRVHYESAGAGAPVVCLVHGTGGTGGVWTRQLEGLADVAHVVAPDLPGHGQSGGAPRASVRGGAAFVAGFLRAPAVRAVVLGRHCMGGAGAPEVPRT